MLARLELFVQRLRISLRNQEIKSRNKGGGLIVFILDARRVLVGNPSTNMGLGSDCKTHLKSRFWRHSGNDHA